MKLAQKAKQFDRIINSHVTSVTRLFPPLYQTIHVGVLRCPLPFFKEDVKKTKQPPHNTVALCLFKKLLGPFFIQEQKK